MLYMRLSFLLLLLLVVAFINTMDRIYVRPKKSLSAVVVVFAWEFCLSVADDILIQRSRRKKNKNILTLIQTIRK